MGLRDLNLESVYDSEHASLIDDFYIPALSHAKRYDRAVGFFSSHALIRAAQGVSALIENGGQMRLVVGAALDPGDFDAIKQGHGLKGVSSIVQQEVELAISGLAGGLPQYRFEVLCWLVATGRLEIKFAFRERGMYHEKIGIITDKTGDQVVFQGSANESEYALLPDRNMESFAVYKSWETYIFEEYGRNYVNKFERLWHNKVNSTHVVDIPSKTYEFMERQIRGKDFPTTNKEKNIISSFEIQNNKVYEPREPDAINGVPFALREHQLESLNKWKMADFSGILKHATGSGKTITAIYGAVSIYKSRGRIFLIVAAPYQNLADQWADNLRHFGFNPHCCYRSKASWHKPFKADILAFNANALNVCCAVVVNDTLMSDAFQSCLNLVQGQTLVFIGDECHHHATSRISRFLPSWEFRMGLSATPFSQDDEKNKNLKKYYGDVVSEYSLERAIHEGVLCQYDYHIHVVRLTADESSEYLELSRQAAPLLAARSNGKQYDEERLTRILLRRARIIGGAEGKTLALNKILEKTRSSSFSLFYCGDGYIEADEDELKLRQIEAVSRVLHNHGWRSSRFTAQENQQQRRAILDAFGASVIDALVAIRVLDEGIDIPDCRIAYLLASSRNPRQFIQRRGRILRNAAGKDKAYIHDFLVLPSEEHEGEDTARELVRHELERAVEFARLSDNRLEVHAKIDSIASDYQMEEVVAYSPPEWDEE